MRCLIQRVKSAAVSVEGEMIGQIGSGALIFVGFHRQDSAHSIPWMVNKLLHLRFFADEQGKMNRNIRESGGQLLVVSQFTLYASCQKGLRPDCFEAAGGVEAEFLYNTLVNQLIQEFGPIQTGKFAAFMEVSLVNDGPITLLLEKEPNRAV